MLVVTMHKVVQLQPELIARFRFSLFAGIAVLAAVPAFSTEPGELNITVDGAPRAWLLTTASRGDTPPGFALAPNGIPTRVAAGTAGPLLVCAGAEERATVCEQVLPDGDRTRRFTLDAGRRIEGRCYLGRDPLAGAAITIRLADVEMRRPTPLPLARRDQRWVTEDQTDREGRYVVEHLAPGRYVLEVTTADGRGEETEPVTIPAVAPPKAGEAPPSRTYVLEDIRLELGAEVTVEVRDSTGASIPKAGVAIAQTTPRAATPRLVETPADDKGVATIRGIDYSLPARVSCAAKGFTRATEQLDTVPPLVTCTLRRLAEVRGRIVDEDGTGLAGVTIDLVGTAVRSASDRAGSFVLPNLDPGDYVLRASSGRHASAVRNVQLEPGEVEDVADVALRPGVEVSARVIDAETGRPVAGATVLAVDPPSGATATSDADGVFELTTGEDAPTHVRVTAQSYAPAYAVLRAGAATQNGGDAWQKVELNRPGRIAVRVWDAATGDACGACTVALIGQHSTHSLITDAAGTARQDGLPAGQYQVVREQVRATSREVTISGGSDTQVVVVVPGETASVELGSPSRRLSVALDAPLDDEWTVRAIASSRQIVAASRVSAGVYAFRRRKNERYEIQVQTPHVGVTIGTVPADYSSEMISMPLGRARLNVRMTRGKTPLAGAMAHLVQQNGRTIAWAITDTAGHASIPFLNAGTYSVVVGNRQVGVVSLSAAGTASVDADVPPVQ
ncbi:MAG TPA: carboxypeptidase regulatory-like domain-containing protein [Thermoanaerobaculia bacterium]|nr:carboxypeptidase regulatory-like domain-containing protein [Thermoanaerobaculia bacterium]